MPASIKAKSNKAGGFSDEMRNLVSPAIPVLSERGFQRQVVQYAELMGWTVWHDVATNAPRACPHCKRPLSLPRNDAGFPDLVLVRPPGVVWAELKSERGRLTVDQRDWVDALRACGQQVFVWRPSSWSEIERVLR